MTFTQLKCRHPTCVDAIMFSDEIESMTFTQTAHLDLPHDIHERIQSSSANPRVRYAMQQKSIARLRDEERISNLEDTMISSTLASIEGMSQSSQSAASSPVFNVKDSPRISLADSSYDGPLNFLEGYDQSNATPADLDTHPEKYADDCKTIYFREQQFFKDVAHVKNRWPTCPLELC